MLKNQCRARGGTIYPDSNGPYGMCYILGPLLQAKGPRATCAKPSMLPCQGPSARLRHLASGAQIVPDPDGEAAVARACIAEKKAPVGSRQRKPNWVRGARSPGRAQCFSSRTSTASLV